MTWLQFKTYVEELGMKDEDKIKYIDVGEVDIKDDIWVSRTGDGVEVIGADAEGV